MADMHNELMAEAIREAVRKKTNIKWLSELTGEEEAIYWDIAEAKKTGNVRYVRVIDYSVAAIHIPADLPPEEEDSYVHDMLCEAGHAPQVPDTRWYYDSESSVITQEEYRNQVEELGIGLYRGE